MIYDTDKSINFWHEIMSARETAYLRASEAMKQRLMRTCSHDGCPATQHR